MGILTSMFTRGDRIKVHTGERHGCHQQPWHYQRRGGRD